MVKIKINKRCYNKQSTRHVSGDIKLNILRRKKLNVFITNFCSYNIYVVKKTYFHETIFLKII